MTTPNQGDSYSQDEAAWLPALAAVLMRADGRIEVTDSEMKAAMNLVVTRYSDPDTRRTIYEARPAGTGPTEETRDA